MRTITIIPRGTDLDLGAVKLSGGVHDDGTDVLADFEHDMLRVRAAGVLLGHDSLLDLGGLPAAGRAAGSPVGSGASWTACRNRCAACPDRGTWTGTGRDRGSRRR